MAPRRSSSKSETAPSRLRALPWLAILDVALVVGGRVAALGERDRSRLVELVRSSGGRPTRLSRREREELVRLLSKLDVRGMAGELLPVAYGRRRRGK